MYSHRSKPALRERIPLVVLMWQDCGQGLIARRMDLEFSEHHDVSVQ
ncbi:MAG: hypothetical protein JOZ49_14495 [Mycolicibacterium sp.]|nr:hypothetical protein [Mycolicibacterium sp.]